MTKEQTLKELRTEMFRQAANFVHNQMDIEGAYRNLDGPDPFPLSEDDILDLAHEVADEIEVRGQKQ